MRGLAKRTSIAAVLLVCLLLGGCSGNVGVGMSVAVPVGDHGYLTVGGSRWH